MAIRTIKVTPAEFDMVVAGIRMLAVLQRHTGIAAESILGGIITNAGENPMPSEDTLEALGDRINTGA